MCFIKSSCVGSRSLFPSAPFLQPTPKASDCSPSFSSCSSLGSFSVKESFPQLYAPDCSMLAQLCSSLIANSQLLVKLQQKIDASENMLEEAHSLSQNGELTCVQQSGEEGSTWRSEEPIVEKLFGEKNYKYRLRLKGKFPTTIYKERNMGLAVELVDGQGKLVLNSNLIGLCLSACETNAQWIPQNEEGDYFIKGKTEVDLYHGEATYQKVYPRDVSRQYSEGKINLVIYPKPSLIQFSSYSSTLESRVRSEEIEPLVLKDITIRAKKKSN